MILDLEAVLPDGSIINTKQAPRAAAGFDLRQLFLGTEGTHGIITKVSFSLRKLPEKSLGQAFAFNDMNDGLKAIQSIVQSGWKPPVVRLYDPTETQRHFPNQFKHGQSSLFLIHEGPKDLVKVESNQCKTISKANGAKPVSSKLVEQWLNHRNKVPTFRELLEQGIVADTIEVSAPWSKISDLYNNVVNDLNGVQGVVMASGHSSHSYSTGTNLYFTFAAIPKDKNEMSDVYKQCWDAAMKATIKSGGSIVHHHGVGRVRREHLEEEIGIDGIKALHKIKNALDENSILNPGLFKLDNKKLKSNRLKTNYKPKP
jgi:alkyldihydroxyacetonephosphate synthase